MWNRFKKCMPWVTILFLFLWSSRSISQIQIIDPDEFSNRKGEIDIEIINNLILVPIDLYYNLRLYFILDTGVSTTIITDPILLDLLNLESIREIKINGYGDDEPLDAYVSSGFNFKLNEFYKFKDQNVIILKK